MKDTTLGALGIAYDVAVGASEASTPLKALLGVLSAIYKDHEVRLPPFGLSTVLKIPSTGNSRCQGEGRRPLLTDSCTGGYFRRTSERCGRAEPPKWTIAVRQCSLFRLCADFSPANSRESRGRCGRCPRSGDSPTMFEMTEMYPTCLRIYKRLSLTTRSVHDLGTVLGVDRDHRWHNK